MRTFEIEGSLRLIGDCHTVEYEPGQMTGSNTLFLRLNGNEHNIPIFSHHINEVIDMLQRGKKAIEAMDE